MLTELKNRGTADVLMIVCDGLAGGPAVCSIRRSAWWPSTCCPSRGRSTGAPLSRQRALCYWTYPGWIATHTAPARYRARQQGTAGVALH